MFTLFKRKIKVTVTVINAATFFKINGNLTLQNEIENENEIIVKMQINDWIVKLSASPQIKWEKPYTKRSSSWKSRTYFYWRENKNTESRIEIEDKREINREFED